MKRLNRSFIQKAENFHKIASRNNFLCSKNQIIFNWNYKVDKLGHFSGASIWDVLLKKTC